MQAVAVSSPVQQTPQEHLRLRVLAADGAHGPAARLRHLLEWKPSRLPCRIGVVHHAMMNARTAGRERRWIVLGEDGRHVTLGRHSDPTEDEIRRAEDALRAQGLSGWLAVAEGDFHTPGRPPRLLEVRSLAGPRMAFDAAVAAFRDRQMDAVGGRPPG